MKNMVIKTKFDNCKTLREVLDKININFFFKYSFILLSLWILYPLIMMFITYQFNNDLARNIMFYILNFIGISGILVGIIYYLKIFYKKEKFNLKKYLPITLGLILLIWCLFASFYSINYNFTFFGEWYRKEGLETYLFYGGVFILGILLKKEKVRNILFNELLIVEVVISIISILNNSFTYSLMHNQEPYTGIFSQFNHYGYYLMFGVLISIFKFLDSKDLKNKLIYICIYILLLYTLILNDTFGCFCAILLTLMFIIIYYIKNKSIKKIIPILIIFILVCCLTFKDDQNMVYKNFSSFLFDAETLNSSVKNKDIEKLNQLGNSRGILWKYGIKYITERPITGYGIETIRIKYKSDYISQTRPHNILIQMGVFTGIPGMILYLLFILSILLRNIKRIFYINQSSICSLFVVICYFISSMFGNSMFYTSPYFFIFLGIITSNTFYIKGKNN